MQFKMQLNLLENFGAQRANHVVNVVSCSPRNSRAIQLLDSLALSCLALSARQLSLVGYLV